jgi:cyclopropane fatty-acyl-phospholipid synthase-like methyltransferase
MTIWRRGRPARGDVVRFDRGDVRRYYDRHTHAFVRYGQGGGAMHRAVWAPGVATRDEAFHHVEDRVGELIRPHLDTNRAPHVVDLGCGVGSSLCYLAQRFPVRGTGITLSPVQARIAGARIRDAGLGDRVTCIEGDYCALPASLDAADLAYAIESFVHAPDPGAMLASCARLIRPGGLLAVCDDFRRPAAGRAAAGALDRFRRGWHVNTLLTPDEFTAAAAQAGFEPHSAIDLSPYLETRRPRDRVIAALDTLVGRWPPAARRFDYLLGGSALQECLARGWIGYDLFVFRRRNVATTG